MSSTTVTKMTDHISANKSSRSSHAAPNNSNSGNKNEAKLTATILSTYDLPNREPPSYISIQIRDPQGHEVASARSGPPSQRHKDRNSFKFDREQVVLEAATLPTLYESTATIQLGYASLPPLTATYPLKQLKIHETTWLILTLDGAEHHARDPNEPQLGLGLGVKYTDDDCPPTLRLQFALEGPYRTEIGSVVSALQALFGLVDHLDAVVQTHVVANLPPQLWTVWSSVNPTYLLLPAVPLLAALVVTAPILLGGLVVALPVALPVLVGLAVVLLGVAVVSLLFWACTSAGRTQIGTLLSPLAHTILSTPTGQKLVYQTGPRPTPVAAAATVVPTSMWARLALSLVLDGLGSASYLVPGVGELVDIVWAPVQTIFILAMYDSVPLAYVSFIEEILPFTDIVPTATAGWLYEFGVAPLLAQHMGGGVTSAPVPSIHSKRIGNGNSKRQAPGATTTELYKMYPPTATTVS